jgi:hypothetical protein
MAMEKRGVIDENTPHLCGDGSGDGSGCGEPTTKEAADKMQSHPVNDMIDAVAEQSMKNRRAP